MNFAERAYILMIISKVLLINGPNLNLLGTREPDQYGAQTLDDIVKDLNSLASEHDVAVDAYQANAEHELIERIHAAAGDGTNLIIINPGAFTHTSVALRDALLAVAIPFYEVHLSNTYARESFRQHSYFSDKAQGVIVGCGAIGYRLALVAALQN